jgi:D-alanine transfer protein
MGFHGSFSLRMPSESPRPHLLASLFALATAGVTLAAGVIWCQRAEERHVHDLAADLSDPKLQGVAIQRKAFQQTDLLVLYGSSELIKQVPSMGAEFFQEYPTGFRVFPVGKEGTSALAIAQKLASVGEDLRGKKVALSISPSFFFEDHLNPEYYEGNFSALQAGELIFSSDISFDLKRDTARRMLAYPETLDDHWLLDATLRRLARGTTLDHAMYYAALPLGWLQNCVGRLQDHFQAALHIEELPLPDDAPPRKPRPLNWDENLRKADALARSLAAKSKAAPKLTRQPNGSRDSQFLSRLKQATEWTDFQLALRTLQELGAKPLLLSMPVHAADLEAVGVSRKAREAFPERLQQMSDRYGALLVYFQAHEEDPLFFADHLDHLSPRGWAYYNETLDDFFHGRSPQL